MGFLNPLFIKVTKYKKVKNVEIFTFLYFLTYISWAFNLNSIYLHKVIKANFQQKL